MSAKESILNKIADFLARRDHSVKEIQEKLAQNKIYEPQEIADAIKIALEKRWLLPEDELAEKVAQSLAIKNKSYFFISNYLEEKGLPRIPFDESMEIMAIERCLSKKFKNYKNLSLEDKQKALRLLSGRGFEAEICYKVLDHTFEVD
jgi:SOS response regulatory protein OraA/RecX